jgi:hypothetical protein
VIVFAHPGHWAGQLLYLAPVLAMLGALVWARVRGPGAAQEEDAGEREDESLPRSRQTDLDGSD